MASLCFSSLDPLDSVSQRTRTWPRPRHTPIKGISSLTVIRPPLNGSVLQNTGCNRGGGTFGILSQGRVDITLTNIVVRLNQQLRVAFGHGRRAALWATTSRHFGVEDGNLSRKEHKTRKPLLWAWALRIYIEWCWERGDVVGTVCCHDLIGFIDDYHLFPASRPSPVSRRSCMGRRNNSMPSRPSHPKQRRNHSGCGEVAPLRDRGQEATTNKTTLVSLPGQSLE